MRPFRRGPSDDDQRAAFGPGSYRSHWRSTVNAVELVLLEVGVANGCFLVDAARPPIETPLELVTQLAPSNGPYCGGMEVA